MRLATFNIRHGASALGRMLGVGELVVACAALDADILALQEVDQGLDRSDRVDQAGEVADATGMSMVFGPAIAVGDGLYGNALLARGGITDVEHVALPTGPRPPANAEPRSAILATVELDGGSLAVAATHLSTRRRQSRVQLSHLLCALDLRPGARALLGDLNRTPPQTGAALDRVGLTMADGPPSFPARKPLIRLDHVAVSRELAITEVDVVLTPVSDHRAVVATVTYRY